MIWFNILLLFTLGLSLSHSTSENFGFFIYKMYTTAATGRAAAGVWTRIMREGGYLFIAVSPMLKTVMSQSSQQIFTTWVDTWKEFKMMAHFNVLLLSRIILSHVNYIESNLEQEGRINTLWHMNMEYSKAVKWTRLTRVGMTRMQHNVEWKMYAKEQYISMTLLM